MCYIPLLRTYGSGVPCIYYRRDWAEDWGIGEIDSYENLVQFWDKAKAENILPFSARNNRGFYQIDTTEGRNDDLNALGISSVDAGGLTFYVYIKDNKLAAMAGAGSGDENFKDFPEGKQYDFGIERYETFAQWQKKGYISADSMNCNDEETPFWAGEAASMIGTLDDIEKQLTNINTYSPEAEIGEFIYVDKVRNMEDGAITTTFEANNGLCVPASSKNIERTMKFLDWLFGEKEHHDLFELGIEGTDYEKTGDDQYQAISSYPENFPGYGFTWNPNYVMFSDVIPENVLKYRKYELQESAFAKSPLAGFRFDTSDMELSTYIAQVSAITANVQTTKLHGILNDGTKDYATAKEMFKANFDQAYANGGEEIEKAIKEQLTKFLEEKQNQ